MLKLAKGNMYEWVSHTKSFLAGECLHKCSYCYVQKNPFGVSKRYKGKLRIVEKEFFEDIGSNKTIFIEHMNDLFAEGLPDIFINRVLDYCKKYNNVYVFQTKNPKRAYEYIKQMPEKFMMGTTIESDKYYPNISKAPKPEERAEGISKFKNFPVKTFITIEPILDFDIDIFSKMIIDIRPDFVNIGADSKNCSLPEPKPPKIIKLISILQGENIIVKRKSNLVRIERMPTRESKK